MAGVFENDFDCADDVFSQFRVDDEDQDGVNIIYASYTCEDYTGDAVVVFERHGKLYENYGSHCSCYGLEGQWEPEEIDVATYEAQLVRRNDTKILDALKQWRDSRR